MPTEGFYLGGLIDPATGDRTDGMVDYDPADLTTHGVIVGMTGSGKTGLGIIYLEEALLELVIERPVRQEGMVEVFAEDLGLVDGQGQGLDAG